MFAATLLNRWPAWKGLDGYCRWKDNLCPHPGHLLWATESKSLLEALQQGVLDQKDYLESQVWCQLLKLADKGWNISAVFVFSHVGTDRNEYADDAITEFLSGVRATTDGVWWKDVARLRHKLSAPPTGMTLIPTLARLPGRMAPKHIHNRSPK
jgi:hypothetical protein